MYKMCMDRLHWTSLFGGALIQIRRTCAESLEDSRARRPPGNAIILESRVTDVALARIVREAGDWLSRLLLPSMFLA
jgi:hypothetical protein